jgi:iron complex transport system ATP-binding protein
VTLEAEHLTIGYGERVVGRALSLSLAAGEVLALLGPNGGGKSTLLKTLIGLIPPLAGEIRLEGKPLAASSVRERARLVAYVPQLSASTFAFTVEAMVVMGRTAHSGLFGRPSLKDYRIAQTMLERFAIAHLAKRPYPLISGGERQLTLLARALAQEPRFIVLDEPTASLDFGNQGKVLREMRALAASGLGVLFTTHDPNHAVRAADRAFLLREGARLACGDVKGVLTHERLEQLYGTPVERLVDASTGAAAFLPG